MMNDGIRQEQNEVLLIRRPWKCEECEKCGNVIKNTSKVTIS